MQFYKNNENSNKIKIFLESNSFILPPNKRISTSPSLKTVSKSPASIMNFFGNMFTKKANNANISLTEENKHESARNMLNKNSNQPFSLKDHLKEDDLPHFGISDENSKSQPDLYMNKSFHFSTKYPEYTVENEKTPSHVEEKNVDQSVNSCLICFDKAPNAVFMDCGHGGWLYSLIYIVFLRIYMGNRCLL